MTDVGEERLLSGDPSRQVTREYYYRFQQLSHDRAYQASEP